MRILFSISYYFPYISGLTISVQRLAEALAEDNYNIEVLTTQNQKILPLSEIHKKVYITRVPYLFKISKGFFMPKYIVYGLNSVKRSDRVIINLPQVEGFIIALIAKLMGKPIFCIYHCEISLPKNFTHRIIEYVVHITSLISLWLASSIITYTKDFAKHSKLLQHFSKKLYFIYPPTPSPNIDLQFKNTLEKKLPYRRYHIGVAARIASEKGIEYLIEAVPYLKEKLGRNFIIIFAGSKEAVGEKRYWDKLLSIIEKYKDFIEFLGIIPPDKMGSFYSLLDVLVLPSINSTEAFGMVQVEAMLCRVPVVASNLPGVRVPIKETGMGEIVEMRDSKDIADKIIRVLNNKKKYIKDKKSIQRIFNFDDTIDRYEKVFESFS